MIRKIVIVFMLPFIWFMISGFAVSQQKEPTYTFQTYWTGSIRYYGEGYYTCEGGWDRVDVFNLTSISLKLQTSDSVVLKFGRNLYNNEGLVRFFISINGVTKKIVNLTEISNVNSEVLISGFNGSIDNTITFGLYELRDTWCEDSVYAFGSNVTFKTRDEYIPLPTPDYSEWEELQERQEQAKYSIVPEKKNIDSFYWEKSTIGRNGSNLKNVYLDIKELQFEPNAAFNDTMVFVLRINEKGVVTDVPLTETGCEETNGFNKFCVKNKRFLFSSTNQSKIKRILFDREDNSFANASYISFVLSSKYHTEMPINIKIYDGGFGLTFYSSIELQAESIFISALRGNEIASQPQYDIGIVTDLYDYTNTMYNRVEQSYVLPTTATPNPNTLLNGSANILAVPNRLSEIYSFTVGIGKIHDSDFSSYKSYYYGNMNANRELEIFKIYEINLFSTKDFYKPDNSGGGLIPPDLNLPELVYPSCSGFDIPCYLKWGVVWFFKDMPIVSSIYAGIQNIVKLVVNTINSFASVIGITASYDNTGYMGVVDFSKRVTTYSLDSPTDLIISLIIIGVVLSFIKILRLF